MEVVELTIEEAKLFQEFMQNYNTFRALNEGNVFSIRGGSAQIHFDKAGQISTIRVNIETYKSR